MTAKVDFESYEKICDIIREYGADREVEFLIFESDYANRILKILNLEVWYD